MKLTGKAKSPTRLPGKIRNEADLYSDESAEKFANISRPDVSATVTVERRRKRIPRPPEGGPDDPGEVEERRTYEATPKKISQKEWEASHQEENDQ